VLEKTRDPNANLAEVVEIISTDQALVSTYLRLVNSAFHGFSRRISTLKQAITLLGFRSVRNVVVNAGVVGIFRKRTFNNQYRHRLWDHSVTCAVAARVLATRTGYRAKEEAFTAGLLHDIGKVVIDQYAPKASAAIMREIEKGKEAREAERAALGVDHTQIGAWIAERWRLPRSLCWVIEFHHDPLARDLPGETQLVRLVAVANALAHIRPLEDQEALRRAIERFAISEANLFRLEPDAIRSTLEEIWEQKAEAMRTFGPGLVSNPAAREEEDLPAPTDGAPTEPGAEEGA
jgi:putative nucleotidyltransferase with HDIG domain